MGKTSHLRRFFIMFGAKNYWNRLTFHEGIKRHSFSGHRVETGRNK